jgi:hypothetical protein
MIHTKPWMVDLHQFFNRLLVSMNLYLIDNETAGTNSISESRVIRGALQSAISRQLSAGPADG